jgi:hypothetical protein
MAEVGLADELHYQYISLYDGFNAVLIFLTWAQMESQ